MSASQNKSPFAWTPLSRALPKTLSRGGGDSGSAEWLNLHWRLAVGAELAEVSRVANLSDTETHVHIAGKEWKTAFAALEHRLLPEWRSRTGRPGLKRFRWQVTPLEFSPSARRTETAPAPARNFPAPEECELREMKETLSMIRDERLRETLARLGVKYARRAAMLCLLLALGGCASFSAKDTGPKRDKPIDLSKSRAVSELGKVADSAAKDPRAYYHYTLGLKAERENRFGEAAAHWQEVADHDPASQEFHSRLARMRLRSGDPDKALAAALKGLQRFPSDPELNMLAGDILSLRDKPKEAIEHYNKVNQVEPTNSRALLLTGVMHTVLGDKPRALDLFLQVTTVEPSNPLGWFYLGRTQLLDKKYAEAVKSLDKSITLRPNFISAREHYVAALDKAGEYDKAFEEAGETFKLSPNDKRIQDYLVMRQETPAGSPTPDELTAPMIEDISVHMKIATIYYEQASYFNAIDEFRLISPKSKDEHATALLIISRIFELVGRLDEATVEMQALLAYEPNSVEIILQIARLQSMNDQMPQAVASLERALGIEPDNDQIHHSLSLALMTLGQFEKAAGAVSKAIALNPNRDSYHFELGSIMERMGKVDQAITSMKKTLELNPSHSNAHNFLGYIYSQRGIHLDDALAHLEKALAIQPRNGYFLDSLAWIYYRRGEFDKALEQLKKALVYTQPDPVLYDHLGDIYFALKNFEEARKAWLSSRSLTIMKKNSPMQELPDEKALEEKIRRANNLLKNTL